MFAVSVVLVVVAFVTLLLGVLGVGQEPLRYVTTSVVASLLAAVFLAAGVLRARPSRRRPGAGRRQEQASWSGASPLGQPREADGRPHVQVLAARAGAETVETEDLAADQEGERFAAALAGTGLDRTRVERLRGRFVTVDRLRAAGVDELADVPGIGLERARRLRQQLDRLPR